MNPGRLNTIGLFLLPPPQSHQSLLLSFEEGYVSGDEDAPEHLGANRILISLPAPGQHRN